jgi:hypothetical protein
MKESKKILILGDSHSENYGSQCYVEGLGKLYEVKRITSPGEPIQKMITKLEGVNIECYDCCIIQLGNPDVHPRILVKHKEYIRRVFGFRIRENLFALPPRFGMKYLFKVIPAFLKRLYGILFEDCYNSPDEILEAIQTIIDTVDCRMVIVMPIFPVRSSIYGSLHNQLAREFNSNRHKIACVYPDIKIYSEDYQADGFHFNNEIHNRIANELSKIIGL